MGVEGVSTLAGRDESRAIRWVESGKFLPESAVLGSPEESDE